MGKRRRGSRNDPVDVGQKQHRLRLLEAEAKIDQALALVERENAPITRGAYRDTLLGVLGKLTRDALRLHCEHVTEYRFYATFDDLMRCFFNKYPAARCQIKAKLKGIFDRDGALHLNGGGVLFGRKAPLSEFYAHEVTHSIDGTAHLISSSQAWLEAWGREIVAGGLLGGNASKKASEGFAEFGQLVLGTERTRQEIAQVMPQSLDVWESHGL